MKLFGICLVVTALSVCVVPTAYGRLVGFFTYQELFDKSDLVVIASPVTKTADIERTYFQSISQTLEGKETRVAAVGVETTFSVSLVIKGDRALPNQFILHHYRVADYPAQTPDGQTVVTVGGPNVVSFDPSDVQRRRDILLFLMKEQDSRYAPYGGQTDPGLQAITALGAVPLPRQPTLR